MGKQVKKFKCPIWLRIKQIISNISIYLSKEGRSAIKIFGNVWFAKQFIKYVFAIFFATFGEQNLS